MFGLIVAGRLVQVINFLAIVDAGAQLDKVHQIRPISNKSTPIVSFSRYHRLRRPSMFCRFDNGVY